MCRNSCTGILRTRAPHCYRTGKSSRRVRGGSGAFKWFGTERWVIGARLRIAESTSRPAFDNAFGRLKQRRKSIGSGLLPTRGHWCETPLFAFTLEAEPAVAVFARDFHVSSERTLAALGGVAPVGKALKVLPTGSCCRATVDSPSFSCRWSHQPNLPPLARRIEKRPIVHADPPPPVSAPGRADEFLVCGAGAKKRVIHSV